MVHESEFASDVQDAESMREWAHTFSLDVASFSNVDCHTSTIYRPDCLILFDDVVTEDCATVSTDTATWSYSVPAQVGMLLRLFSDSYTVSVGTINDEELEFRWPSLTGSIFVVPKPHVGMDRSIHHISEYMLKMLEGAQEESPVRYKDGYVPYNEKVLDKIAHTAARYISADILFRS